MKSWKNWVSSLFRILVSILLFSISLKAQENAWQQQVQAEKQRWEQQLTAEREKWEQYKSGEQQRWQDYLDRESQAWQAHVAAVQQLWQQPRFSGVRNWVGYSGSNTARFEVNFESGDILIEVLGDRFREADRLQKEAIEMLTRLLETRVYPSLAPPASNPLQPVAPEIHPPQIKPYRFPDGRSGSRLELELKLPANHVQQRAQIVRPYVEEYCGQFDIDPDLAMAVIHCESSFNPRAMSTFPMAGGKTGHAYGLMQIVPHSGGAEAYRTLERSGQPTAEILFDPEKNLEIGIAYLHRLKFRYFPAIRIQHSQQLVMASAYNTGPGNAAKAFSGNRDIDAAVKRINQLSGQQVQERLLRQLPYAETRRYLRRIIDRLAFYRGNS